MSKDRQWHQSTDRVKAIKNKKTKNKITPPPKKKKTPKKQESADIPSSQAGKQPVFHQTSIATVSRATLGILLRDRAEHVMAFPSATIPSTAGTETENSFTLLNGGTGFLIVQIGSKYMPILLTSYYHFS